MKLLPDAPRFAGSLPGSSVLLALLLGGATLVWTPPAARAESGWNTAILIAQPENFDALGDILNDLNRTYIYGFQFPGLPIAPTLAPQAPANEKGSAPANNKAPALSSNKTPAFSDKKATAASGKTNSAPDVLHRVLAFHEKAIVGVHTAVWNALPKPWMLLAGNKAETNKAATTSAPAPK